MVSSLSDVSGVVAPNMGKVGKVLMFAGVGLLCGAVLLLGLYFVLLHLKFNKKIVLFKNVGNKIIPVFNFTACFERISLTGDYWCKVRKANKILPRPKIEMGRDTFWMYEREDGEWINFCLKDFDEIMKSAGVHYLDEDMRLQRIGIQKHLELRYKKSGFWDKYGTTIMWVTFVIIVTVCLVVLFDRLDGLVEAINKMASSVGSMATNVGDVSARTNSGVVPVSLG